MYNIRLAQPEDFEAIKPMCEKFWAFAFPNGEFEWHLPSVVEHYINLLKSGFVLVAEEEGQPIGMIGCLIHPFHLNTTVSMCTETVWWVEEDFRGLRVSSDLVRQAEEHAKVRGCDKITMGALAQSPGIIRDYYKSRGYSEGETAYVRDL